MRRISFNQRFVNEAGNDLIPGKIHTIRQNYDHWKRFEGREVALFTWEGKPYRSKQKVFCVKRIVSVQEVLMKGHYGFYLDGKLLDCLLLSKNDGFANENDFAWWFFMNNHRPSKMAVLHFTDFRY
jgi:hypothetical protein